MSHVQFLLGHSVDDSQTFGECNTPVPCLKVKTLIYLTEVHQNTHMPSALSYEHLL